VTVIHFGGRFVEHAEVSVLDDGYRLGDGVFATMRAYGGEPFRIGEHLAALAAGAAIFEIPLPTSLESIAENAREAASRIGDDARLRVTLTRGAPLSIVATPMDAPPTDAVDVVTVSLRAAPPACFDPRIKTTSYAPHVLARREAERRGAFEGVMLAIDGTVASATMANVFALRGDELVTPPVASGCRPGVTRGVVLGLAARVGLRPRERTLSVDELRGADEAFLTSTRVECLPIARLDGDAIPVGPRTEALRAAFHDVVRKETGFRPVARGRR